MKTFQYKTRSGKTSAFKVIIQFFNSKNSNKIFTRNEFFMALKGIQIADSYLDTVRCYLVNAGYLKDIEPGVYRKLKKIPDDITITRLLDEAYPESSEKRKAQRRLDFAVFHSSRRSHV